MTLIAALRAPDFALQALLRVAPARRDEPLVIINATLQGGGTPILVASAAARTLGIVSGMTVTQARAIAPQLAVVPREKTFEDSACDALKDVAQAFSPRVEVTTDAQQGWAFLDAEGLTTLIGPAEAVARELACSSRRVGLEVSVGVARTKTLARLAALAGEGTRVVSAVTAVERAFVARLSLATLEPESQLMSHLARFGIHTVAELLKLPAALVGERLGRAGLELLRRARGDEEGGGLRPISEPVRFVESTSLDYDLDNLEPLLFVLQGILDRILSRLSVRGFLCGNLHLSLACDGGGSFERVIKVSAPNRDSRALLSLCRLGLTEAPPQAPVTRVTVEAIPALLRPVQLSFLEPVGPAPHKLAITMASLAALCGEARVGAPEPLDTYCDDRFTLRPFALDDRARISTVAPGSGTPPTTLRRVRPPQIVEVIRHGDTPVQIDGGEFSGRIVDFKGPFRRSGEWWEEREAPARASSGDVYDAQLESGLVVRLLADPRRSRWLLVGCYD